MTYGWRLKANLDTNGRPQPERHVTRAEQERRRDHVVRLWRQGATRQQIARALDVSPDIVGRDLRRSGLRNQKYRVKGLPVDPEPIDWLEPEEPKHQPVSPYQHSVTLSIWRTFVRDARAQHHANRLAHDAADAEEADDLLWLSEAAEIMQSAITEATRLHRVLTDKQAQMRAQREEKEPSTYRRRVRLRAVPND